MGRSNSDLTIAGLPAIPPAMARAPQTILAILGLLGLASCGFGAGDDTTKIVFIGSPSDLQANGLRLSPAGQHLRAATSAGLVSLNEEGEVVPALAERWIVTEDGLSYIFRLQNTDWPDGTAMTGESVQAALRQNIRDLQGTSLGIDLTIIDEIRAMTGRVVEIRLKSQMPQFLQLMAQPELGLRRGGAGAGPMVSEAIDGGVRLTVIPPDLPEDTDIDEWREQFRVVDVSSMPARQATEAFEQGAADAVFNGRLASLPLADTGPLSSGTVRLDAVFGLFGLQITNANGLLAEPARREAIAMAIDRSVLLQPFNIGGWSPSTRIAPANLPGRSFEPQERWTQMSIEQRRSAARARLASGDSLELTIALPEGPGSDTLFTSLAANLAEVGITLVRVQPNQRPDLRLVDRLARYSDDRWFLNQFNCALKRGLCSKEADAFVGRAIAETDTAQRAALMRSAEQALLDSNVYIPLGAPIRWSLIRGNVDGFSENRWGLHPLFPMARRPI